MANNPSQTTDEEENKKILAIALPIFFVVVLLLRLIGCCLQEDSEEQDAGGENRAHQQQQSSEAGGSADRAPSSMAAGAAVEVSPVRAAEPEPPLVCTYRKADGWRDGSCGVCLAELDDGDVLRVLPVCMHYFHAACVGEWLSGHDTCPLCRAPVIAPAAAPA